MKGDFSRNTYDPKNPYFSVRLQQGRVILDADWNEQADMLNHRQATTARHIFGDCGGNGHSFQISLADPGSDSHEPQVNDRRLPTLEVHPGEYYVHGYPCSLKASHPIPLSELPVFDWQPHMEAMLRDHDHAVIYLDVWEQHLTIRELPELAEPALGGADTTTRTRLVWQIKCLPLSEPPPEDTPLTSLPTWKRLTTRDALPLSFDSGNVTENSMYRVEIHTAATESQPATWKWSRNNGVVACALTDIEAIDEAFDSVLVKIKGTQASVNQLQRNDAVELSCERWQMNGRPGIIGTIKGVNPDDAGVYALTIKLGEPIAEMDLALLGEADQRAILRQWDFGGQQDSLATPLPVNPGERVGLDQGILVTFPESGEYRPGDYWQVALRTGNTGPAETSVPRQGPWHVYAPLAILSLEQEQWELTDCRAVYNPMTGLYEELLSLRQELAETNERLEQLQAETDREDEEQEDEITALKQEIQELHEHLNILSRHHDKRTVRCYRSKETLDIGEVVANSPSEDNYIIRAHPSSSPIGVVTSRPDEYERDQYNVVLSGPAACRVHGIVQPGDLLEMGTEAGHLKAISLWTRLFRPERIIARVIDIATTSDHAVIDVYILPQGR